MSINLIKWREQLAQRNLRRFYVFTSILFVILLLVIAAAYTSLKSLHTRQQPLTHVTQKTPKRSTSKKRPVIQKKTPTPISSKVFTLHYADAETLKKSLKSSMKSLLKKGWIESDSRTNQLWVSANQSELTVLNDLITQLDVPVSEVRIKARIVTIDEEYVRSLGIIFGSQPMNATSQNASNLSMDLPTLSSGTGIANIPIARLQNGQLLDLELAALSTEGHATVISSPELIASNRQMASIASGDEVPYQEQTGEGNTSVAFKQALLQLNVTPDIMPKKRILLHLNVHQDAVSGLTVNGVPAIRTQQIKTQVLVNNKETLVLGGIYEQANSQQSEGIPFLSKVPLLGILFQRKQRSQQRKQLLIFITPEIITPTVS